MAELPPGWTTTPLGEVADVVSGATPKTGVDHYWDGPIAWATPKDLSTQKSRKLRSTERSITQAGLDSCASQLLPVGSVLLSSRAPIGLVTVNTIPVATNQGFKSLVPGSDLEPRFLAWWLRSNRSTLEARGNGATFKELSKRAVSDLQIPLPPIEEQRRIAGILDHVDDLRAKRRDSIDRLDALMEASFRRFIRADGRGANTATLHDVLRGGLANGLSPATDGSIEARVLTLSAVTSGVFKARESKNAKFAKNPTAKQVVGRDSFLISRGNGNVDLVGVGVLGTECDEVTIFPDTVIGGTIDRSRIEPEYLAAAWRTTDARAQVRKAARTTNGTYKVNQRGLGGVTFPLPPIEAQREFAKRARAIEAQKERYRAQLAELDRLFASLQARAFRGEL